MAPPTDCTQNTDPLKLMREGTSQDQRLSAALDPAHAPVDEHTSAHGIVFAQAYATFLKYYETNNVVAGDWKPFFSEDVSAQLALAAVQDVAYYRTTIKAHFDFLNNNENKTNESALKNNLGSLFNRLGMLAKQLDVLKDGLPIEVSLKETLQNLIQSRLAPAFRQLIAYYKADLNLPAPHPLVADTPAHSDIAILGAMPIVYKDILNVGLSKDWITDGSTDWDTYVTAIPQDSLVYGTGTTTFERINHIATHNFFTGIFDQLLKGYARVVNDAKLALEQTFTHWDRHEPHYALFLAYLRLFEYARVETNTLTKRHLDFYYREVLRLKEKSAQSGHAHLLVELAKHIPAHSVEAGELFKAGKDDLGREVFFANDRSFVANQAKVTALKAIYRHGDEKVGITAPTDMHAGRLYAAAVINSDNGREPELTSVDQSWHPFYNKIYQNGALAEINMPEAEVGFAIASHYLWMAEGSRWVGMEINVTGYSGALFEDFKKVVMCRLTSEQGWIEKDPIYFFPISASTFWLVIEIEGGDAPITPYVAKIHGYTFATDLPVLLIKFKHDAANKYAYSVFQDITVTSIKLHTFVFNLKTLALSNDFGPIDTSKPFQPYGASPVANNALVIGSKEIFQKTLTSLSVRWTWFISPTPYQTAPMVKISFLNSGQWRESNFTAVTVGSSTYSLTDQNNLDVPVIDAPDLTKNEFYATHSRHGFLRLSINDNFGQAAYQDALRDFLIDKAKIFPPAQPAPEPTTAPIIPVISELTMHYSALQEIDLNSNIVNEHPNRKAQFFHIAPFGQAEQHPTLNSAKEVFLFPQFDFRRDNTNNESEAEFYIGITGLKPPQNLSLLFQVVDGTANPLSAKPDPHIHWSYLRTNEWIAFKENEIEDRTDGLLNSGIITFAIPRDASDTNTLLPAEMYWIRATVAAKSDAVCRLILVAAQALEATFTNKGNDPAFPGKVLAAGTITKLDQPAAAVKKIAQPFATFGGRSAELPVAFYTRVSERLRHKDRAITLWDYERLVLEAFPQIYRVKCLNHTQYEPNESGTGIYRELAPGHVTIITVPNQQFHNLRDPLRPYTSLGLLQEIHAFLQKKAPCFVKLHVKNPQFEAVSVAFTVRFYEGTDETFHKNKLQEAITRFLSPWAFPGSDSPTFGGKIYQAVLLNFIEEQPYVDYVTDFQLFHYIVNNGVTAKIPKMEIEGSTAVSILVSMPAKNHVITVINPAEAQTPRENCPCAI